MSGISMPPTNPTLPVLDSSAASAPTRNDPSSSLNLSATRLGGSDSPGVTVKSTQANFTSGNSPARRLMSSENRNPTPNTSCDPPAASSAGARGTRGSRVARGGGGPPRPPRHGHPGLGGARPRAQVEAAPAARLVQLAAAHHHAPPALDLAVGAVRGGAAHHADC